MFHTAAAHGVPTLQSFSLPKNSTQLITERYPLDLPPASRRMMVAPSGLSVLQKSVSTSGVLHPSAARCSPGLPLASTAFVLPKLESTEVSSSAHDLTVRSLQADFGQRPTAYSARVARHLPFSRTPAIVAFPGLSDLQQATNRRSASARATVTSSAFAPFSVHTPCQNVTH